MRKAFGRIKEKMRFKFVFEPIHMIDCMDAVRQLIPKMKKFQVYAQYPWKEIFDAPVKNTGT